MGPCTEKETGSGQKSGQQRRILPASHLSDDQRAVLGGRGHPLALQVLHEHGLGRLRLAIAHPPVEATGISDVRDQTAR